MNAITLDQLKIFAAITEEGSFAAAARKLGRAQSAITYAVQKLEDESGVVLFDRSHYRAKLTEQGLALLPRVQLIMDNLNEFKVQAKAINQGIEAEIVLVLDNFLPLSMFSKALMSFRQAYPLIQLRINAVWTNDLPKMLASKQGMLGLTFNINELGKQIEYNKVCEFDLVVVAAPHHPLALIKGKISQNTLRKYLQIVISNPNKDPKGPSFGVIGLNQWRVSEARLRHNLILDGLGWGSMPYPMVENEIKQGRLVVLSPEVWDGSDQMPKLSCVVANHKSTTLGPGATFLKNALLQLSLNEA